MNTEQRKTLIYALYGLSALMVFIFWRLGTQYEYSSSLLVFQLSEVDGPGFLTPNGRYGLRLRMGAVGVVFGAILPVVLACAAAFLAKADKR